MCLGHGRAGLDFSIALYYNSLVWTRQGNTVEYNADHGTPAPGFQLGFPKIQPRYFDSDDSVNAYIMVTPSGGRVEMKQVGTSGVYESADSTYTQFTPYTDGSGGIAYTTDGTQYFFLTITGGEMRCTGIRDRNGNYMNISSDMTTGRLLSVTDTLGRVVSFANYGDSNLWKVSQTWGGVEHVYATFNYGTVAMSVNFPGLGVVGLPQGGSPTA